jgi:hypothetical protein
MSDFCNEDLVFWTERQATVPLPTRAPAPMHWRRRVCSLCSNGRLSPSNRR